MIVELDDEEGDFDTDDAAAESPERVVAALRKLAETVEGLEADKRASISALTAVGLSYAVNDPELFIKDRAKAVEAHTRMLAEFDADHPR